MMKAADRQAWKKRSTFNNGQMKAFNDDRQSYEAGQFLDPVKIYLHSISVELSLRQDYLVEITSLYSLG